MSTRPQTLQRAARGSRFGAASLAIWLACAVGCQQAEVDGGDDLASDSEASPRPRLILLISIDTLRPDHLGAYGYTRPTSPEFDRLAATGVLFEDASATSPWTLPSHASLLTGLYPHSHRLTNHDFGLRGNVRTLALRLRRRGYETAAVVNSHNLSKRFGLDRGFDRFLYVQEAVERQSPSSWVTDQAMAWLRERGDQPMFLFVHYYDVHSDYNSLPEYTRMFESPYDGEVDGTTLQLHQLRLGRFEPAEGDAARLIDLYDAGVRQMDGELKRLISFLEENALLDDTLLILTSDHGEEFLEHGSVLHGTSHYEESIRIPLLFRYPRGLPAKRVPTPVSLVDVMPTILEIAGTAQSHGADEGSARRLDGLSLSPLWRTGADTSQFSKRAIFSEADHSYDAMDVRRAVRRGNFKLHYDSQSLEVQLFDLASDPAENRDVSDQHPELTRTLLADLVAVYPKTKLHDDAGPRIELTPEEQRRLESLGYFR